MGGAVHGLPESGLAKEKKTAKLSLSVSSSCEHFPAHATFSGGSHPVKDGKSK